MSEQYLIDTAGKTVGVVLDVDSYNRLRDAASEATPTAPQLLHPLVDSTPPATGAVITISEAERRAILAILQRVTVAINELATDWKEDLAATRSAANALDLIGDLARRFASPESGPVGQVPDEKRRRLEAWFASADALSQRVSAAWQGEMSAVEAVQEQRREL